MLPRRCWRCAARHGLNGETFQDVSPSLPSNRKPGSPPCINQNFDVDVPPSAMWAATGKHLTAAHLRRGNITRHGGVGETFWMLSRRACESDTGVRMLPRRTRKSDHVVRGNIYGDVGATGKHLTAAHLRRGNITRHRGGGETFRMLPRRAHESDTGSGCCPVGHKSPTV